MGNMGIMKNGKVQLSPSALNVFLECEKCFWLEYRAGVRRPRGFFPSLPGGMDVLIKKYFDRYRSVGKVPPELEGKVSGHLFDDVELLNKWRSWKSGLSHYDKESGGVLVGALDDCLIEGEQYIPVDYKTRGFDLEEGSESFYQNQMSCYSFLLGANRFKQPSYAYLVYYIPKDITEGGSVRFGITVKKVTTNPELALATFRRAVGVVKQDWMPVAEETCKFCAWKTQQV
jgi:hypothetical protein